MKNLITFLLCFFTLVVFSQDPLKKYEVQATKRLKADNFFIWQGDTIKKDSIVYAENKIDSIRFRYINGGWSGWFKVNDHFKFVKNGLYADGDTVKLGGTLTENTVFNMNDKGIDYIGTGDNQYIHGEFNRSDSTGSITWYIDPNGVSIEPYISNSSFVSMYLDGEQFSVYADSLLSSWNSSQFTTTTRNIKNNVHTYNNGTEIIQDSVSIKTKFFDYANLYLPNGMITDYTGIRYTGIDTTLFQDSTLVPKYYVKKLISDVVPDSIDVSLLATKVQLGDTAAQLRSEIPDVSVLMVKANNLSDLTNTTTARDNLGVEIGSDVLAYRTFGTAANNNTGDFAPASDSGNYVQVSPVSAQAGSVWLTGVGIFGNEVSTSSLDGFRSKKTSNGTILYSSINAIRSWQIDDVGGELWYYNQASGNYNFKLKNTGGAEFSSVLTINAPVDATSYKLSGVSTFLDWTRTGYAGTAGMIPVSQGISVTPIWKTLADAGVAPQTLTISGTAYPTISLSGSNTATFAAGSGISLGQSDGTITITNTGGGGGSLPSQTGHETKFLFTDGTNPSWQPVVTMETDPSVYTWARATSKPTYTYTEVGAASSGHNHSGVYEPHLGYPANDGYLVQSTTAGARSFLDPANFTAAYNDKIASLAFTGTTTKTLTLTQQDGGTITGTFNDIVGEAGSMVYPDAGITLSTGTAWGTAITNNSGNWNTAYGWGNHASAGYLTSQTSHADVLQDGDFASQGIMLRGATSGTYSILTDNSANWNSAYSWGNHASAGYQAGLSGTGFVKIVGTTISYDNSTYETHLGYPATNGYILSSTTGGTRSWIVPNSGSGTSGRVTYWSGTNALTSDADFTFDGIDLRVGATNGTGNVSSGNFTLTSDRRLKKNIRPISGLNWVRDVRFKQFVMKGDKSNTKRYGVVAQDIERFAPELVHTDEDKIKSVAYTDLLIALVADLTERVTILESQVKKMNKKTKRHEK